MLRLVLLGCVAVSLTGCSGIKERFSWGKNRVLFEGESYRGAARSDRSERKRFVATVRPVSASLDGAIEAGRHEGVKHCIKYYGTSDIIWDVGPDTAREALVIENDTLTFMGECQE